MNIGFSIVLGIQNTQSAEPLIRLLYYTLNKNPFFTEGREYLLTEQIILCNLGRR